MPSSGEGACLVYILRCSDGSLHVGNTSAEMTRRIAEAVFKAKRIPLPEPVPPPRHLTSSAWQLTGPTVFTATFKRATM